MSHSQSNAETLEDSGCTRSVVVHLTIYETSDSLDHHSIITDCSTIDLETSIIKGSTIADLKTILESQDVIPENLDNQFVLEIRLGLADTSCLQDFEVIQDSVKDIYITLKPQCISSPSLPSQGTWGTSLHPATETTLRQQRSATPATQPLNLLMNNLLRAAPNTPQPFTSIEPSSNHQGALSDMILTDPAMLQQMMNSTVMRSIVSNSDILRTILESNPQIRQLREQHPELNHLLNDTELLQQSMQAMQNPGLMQEMISNTDRVLNNIDAIPGGYNALRRVYQSIQEPIWDASFGCGISQSENNYQPTHYNIKRSGPPSTETIPNPWAPQSQAHKTSSSTNIPTSATSYTSQRSRNVNHETRLTTSSPMASQPQTQTNSLKRSPTVNSRPEESSTLPDNLQKTPLQSHSPTSQPCSETNCPQPSFKMEEKPISSVITQENATHEVSETVNNVHNNRPVDPPSLPFFYPHLFTNNRRLRSLGGLTLPLHIQGVIRPSQSKDDEDSTEDPVLSKTTKNEDNGNRSG